jgi:hypothetical protein
MGMKFANNATTALASGINSSVTSLTVTSGQGALFPSLSGSDYFYCTLANLTGSIEIIKVTARSTDTFTIVRGQDGTSGAAWLTGDTVELRLVAASLNDIPKLDEANTFSVAQTFTAGAVSGPWTTAGRPATPTDGLSGFNTTLNKLETWDATNNAWVSSGGATGGGGDDVFYENGQTVTTSYTITSGKNAMSVGPITINSGAAVTVPSGSRWLVF